MLEPDRGQVPRVRDAGEMRDYGLPLRFGVFITPTNSPADAPVRIALLADELGLDLVTFQDHPYQPTFHDTWTLLSWVAARTERIGLSGNVLNLPLRPPAVLARAAASLDLLSGGRLTMGLGAGAFWDGIEAMGGPKRTPGESVTALGEAIDILRDIWDADERGGVRRDGESYRVHGAKRGPAPAHTIPIWLGAYGPRMLRMVGRTADGWLPSESYLKPGDLARSNAAIDAAARKAGRDPREITRVLNIGPGHSADSLADLAAEGMSTFILAADDPTLITQFATEIAPAVRDLVAERRAKHDVAATGPVRPARARSRRIRGIDYDGVPQSLQASAVEPGDAGYRRYTSSYMRGGTPGIVLRPATVPEVSDAVAFAARHTDVPLGIFSVGHGLSGRSINDGGVVIDVGAFRHIDVTDPDAGIVQIGPGARWVDVAKALAPHGLAITSGDYGGVGVGGLATSGGVGMFARNHGLTIDLIRSVDMVLADGRAVHTDAHTEPDLFWAVRGAGANFGIVTNFEFQAPAVGEIGFAQLVFDATETARFIEQWGQALEQAPRTVSGEFLLGRTRPGQSAYAQAFLLVDDSDPDRVAAALQPIASIAPLADQSVAIAGYDAIMSAFYREMPQQGRGQPHSHSGLVEHLSTDFAGEVAAMLGSGASSFFQIRSVGGAVADHDPMEMAYGWRSANFAVSALGTARSGLDEWWKRLLPHFEGLYSNFETDTGPEALARAFPPDNLARLRALKARYDPTGLFRDNFFIPPEAAGSDHG